MSTVPLSRRWLTRSIPPILGPSAVAAAFWQEATISWETATLADIEAAYDHLIGYSPIDWVYDEWEEGEPSPNAGNLWHPLLQLYELIDILSAAPGICPASVPFY